jgi:hypothetical protein
MAKRVRLKWDKDRGVGIVIAEGPSQTAVKWSGYGERVHINTDLIDVKEDGTIHLCENWRELDTLPEDATTAICETKKLQRWQLALRKRDATCPSCLALASKVKLARVAAGKEKKSKNERTGLLQFGPDQIIRVVAKNNPYKGAKGLRFEKIKEFHDKTVQEFSAGGGNLEALSNRVKDKMVEVK